MLQWTIEKYNLLKEKIYIYGAATTGAIFLRKLHSLGLDVRGFIDQRGAEIGTYYDLPVCSLKDIDDKNVRESVVIIAIKNVFEHESIAKKLYQTGCTKLIFRPKSVVIHKNESNLDKEMNIIYDQLFNGKDVALIPRVSGIENDELEDLGIRKKIDDDLIANIPLPYVYVDDYKGANKWSDMPCLGLFPHIGLFRYFMGESGAENDVEVYVNFCREAARKSGGIVTSEAWEKSIFARGLDVYYNMEASYYKDKDFFCSNAVHATLNDKGYFNIHSGKHRCAYLTAKREKYIPLRISRVDYDKWCKQICSKEEAVFWLKKNDERPPVLLWNPYMYDSSILSSSIYDRILFEMIELIFRRRINKEEERNSILICDSYMEFYTPLFRMYGLDVVVIDKNQERNDLYKSWCDIKSVPTCLAEPKSKHEYEYIIGENISGYSANVVVDIRLDRESYTMPWLVGLSVGSPVYAYLKVNWK